MGVSTHFMRCMRFRHDVRMSCCIPLFVVALGYFRLLAVITLFHIWPFPPLCILLNLFSCFVVVLYCICMVLFFFCCWWSVMLSKSITRIKIFIFFFSDIELTRIHASIYMHMYIKYIYYIHTIYGYEHIYRCVWVLEKKRTIVANKDADVQLYSSVHCWWCKTMAYHAMKKKVICIKGIMFCLWP